MGNDEIKKDCGKRVRIAITLCGMKLPAFGKKYKISLTWTMSRSRLWSRIMSKGVVTGSG